MGPVGIRRLYEVRTSYRRPLDVQRTSDAHRATKYSGMGQVKLVEDSL